MREPRNPFRLRSSEHIDQDATFLRLFEPGILDVLSTENLWTGVRLIRSAAGAGKTSLLRLFTPSCLLTLHAHRKQEDWVELYQRLKDLGAIEDSGPKVLGVMLQCGRYYAALALAALVKFSYFVAASAAVLAVGADEAIGERRPPPIAVAFAGLVALFWLLGGQSLLDLPAFLVSSLDLSSGYAQAMSLRTASLGWSIAEVAAFVHDDRPDAYEHLVDRLLASPHFGERWGRHWLDLARYADSDGYESDRPRPHAWRFRNWVIDALNRDLPFDQFTAQQLAGDLLPAPCRGPA